MAVIPKPSILSLAVLLLVAVLSTALPAADALKVDGQKVNKMFVTGKACCSPTGGLLEDILTSPLAGAIVNVLNGGNVIGSGVTGVDGGYNICINSGEVLGLIESVYDLVVSVALPIATCPVLSTITGVLVGVPALAGGVVGGVCNLSVSSYKVVLN